MQFDFGSTAKAYLGGAEALFNIRGLIRDNGLVHPLDTDSKVLATLFDFHAWCQNSPNPLVSQEVVSAAKQAPMSRGLFGPA